MVDYSWFRLLVRAVGLALLCIAVPQVLGWLFWLVQVLSEPQAWAAYGWAYSVSAIGAVAQAGFGVYLLRGGKAVVNFCLRGVYGRCPHCDYDVRSITAPTCPECGFLLPGRTGSPVLAPPAPSAPVSAPPPDEPQ